VTFLADIQRKQREQRALRQRIEQELAEREIDSDTVTVLVPRALAERLRRFAAERPCPEPMCKGRLTLVPW
jgi:hypothetical protein